MKKTIKNNPNNNNKKLMNKNLQTFEELLKYSHVTVMNTISGHKNI